jgi:hypothetical protein
MSDLERRLDFLRTAGAERVEHSGENLLDHLLATRDVLAGWGARAALCDAALFHSVYGTQFLGDGIVGADQRHRVRELIGDEAEAVAWLWHSVRRESLRENLERDADFRIECADDTVAPISRQQFLDLVNLMIADAVEQLPRRGPESVERQQGWLTPFLPMAMPEAARAARECFSRHAHR